jgi:E3 ubiquitin-protein ligase BRE1
MDAESQGKLDQDLFRVFYESLLDAGVFDMATHVTGDSQPAFGLAEALKSRFDTTERLVAAFVQLGGRNHQDAVQNDMYFKCQKAQSEVRGASPSLSFIILISYFKCTVLRSELALVHSKLSEITEQKDKYLAELIAAESRVDRLQSKTIPVSQDSPKANGDRDQATPELKSNDEEEEPKREKPLSPSVSGLANWWEFMSCLISCPPLIPL